METYEPFDLKITKLTGQQWDRNDLAHLAEQLLESQGKPRTSIENRIVICFDESVSSATSFLKNNEDLIILTLLEIVDNPYKYTHWLQEYKCWCTIALIKRGKYYDNTEGLYYEHPLGDGLREPGKAEFERYVLGKVARLRNNLRLASNARAHGIDGYIKLDLAGVKNKKRQVS